MSDADLRVLAWREDSPTGWQIALEGYRQPEPNCFLDGSLRTRLTEMALGLER
jgi:hypothetical protein